MMKQPTKSHSRIVRFVGGLGYFSVALQWLWLALLYGPRLAENKTIHDLFLPHNPGATEQTVVSIGQPSPLLVAVALIVTALVLVATVVILIKLPMSFAKAGKKSTQAAAHVVLPAITHHQPVAKQRERIITAQIVIWLKFIGSIAPFVLLLGGMFISLEIPFGLFVVVGAALAINSLVWFTLEYYLAKWFNIPLHKVF